MTHGHGIGLFQKSVDRSDIFEKFANWKFDIIKQMPFV